MEMAGAQILMEGFLREGVERIFGYAGATICPIMDALMATPRISYTLVRTEQNAGHMASGYARVTGKTGVCIVTSGPGATNLITGIATAYMDSIPLVAVTGQVPSGLLGRDIFQEVDITGAVTPFIKHCYLVKDAARLPQIISEAFYIASSGRPGPVLIDIPIDIQEQMVQDPVFPDSVSIRGYNPSVRGNDKQIMRVAEAISQAERPVICAGGGVFLAGAEEELRELVSRTGIPSVTTMMGLSLFPTEHPLNMGMIGTHGNQCANKALARADLLIMTGTRAADRAIFSPDEIQRRMPNIHIDVDPAEIGKNMSSTVPLVGDVKIILRQLLERDIAVECEPWRTQLQAFRREELSREFPSHPGYVFPGRLLRLLGQRLKEDAAVCVDVGQNQIFACKHLVLRGGRLLTSGGLGTMGFGLPAAMGAQVAYENSGSERRVVHVAGDGGIKMTGNEYYTIARLNLPIISIIVNNSSLGMIRQLQKVNYKERYIACELDYPMDYAAYARSFGIEAENVDSTEGFAEAFQHAMAERRPYVIVMNIHRSFVEPMIKGGARINEFVDFK